MHIQRITWQVKPGKQEQVVEQIKKAQTMIDAPHGTRIYVSYIGQFNKVVYDLEFENLAELEEFWAKWWSLPETPAFMENWNQLVEVGDGSDVWTLVE